MNKKNKNLILSILAALTVILITGGVTYAFFNYAKEGTTDNIITTGSILFLYTEVDGIGNGIKLENAFPISDEVGKKLSKTNEYFDFKITSDTTSGTSIPYEITARKNSDSDDIDEYVRVYLTKGETEEEVLLDNYNNLTQTSKVDSSKYTEKTIYNGKVPSNSPDYEETFRLRMWLREGTRFENEAMNNKTFTLTVNVYANAKVVTNEEISLESNADIKTLSVNDTELTAVEEKDYDYETTLPENTTSTTINIETESPDATVKVEKVDSLAMVSNVKRLAVSKILELTNGDNYFKVSVISENKQVENQYKIKITVEQGAVGFRNAILEKYEVIEDEPTLTATSTAAGENGLYKWTNPDNSNEVSYYFRGNVNNTVEFAGQTWNVIRINEDGTIRLITNNIINKWAGYKFNPTANNYKYMYYSNSNVEDGAKYIVDDWYQVNIVDKDYDTNVVTGDYFCEEARLKSGDTFTSGNAIMNTTVNYKPTFKCSEDANKKGIINDSVGLITYDEVVYAGGKIGNRNYNKDYYLYNDYAFWTMSPAGVNSSNYANIWEVYSTGYITNSNASNTYALRPVINLKADTPVIEGDTTVWKVVE